MADNIEQYGAIIRLQYQGSDQIQRYLRDLASMAGVSQQTLTQMTGVFQSFAQGQANGGDVVRNLARGLGVGAEAIREYERAYRTLAQGGSSSLTRTLAADQRTLDEFARSTNRSVAQLAEARQALARLAAVSLGQSAFRAAAEPHLATAVPDPARRAAVAAYTAGGITQTAAAAQAGVSPTTLRRDIERINLAMQEFQAATSLQRQATEQQYGGDRLARALARDPSQSSERLFLDELTSAMAPGPTDPVRARQQDLLRAITNRELAQKRFDDRDAEDYNPVAAQQQLLKAESDLDKAQAALNREFEAYRQQVARERQASIARTQAGAQRVANIDTSQYRGRDPLMPQRIDLDVAQRKVYQAILDQSADIDALRARELRAAQRLDAANNKLIRERDAQAASARRAYERADEDHRRLNRAFTAAAAEQERRNAQQAATAFTPGPDDEQRALEAAAAIPGRAADGDRLQAARTRTQRAEEARAALTERSYASQAEYERQYRDATAAINRARVAEASVERQILAAREREARDAQRREALASRTGLAGQVANFRQGFAGRDDRGPAEQLGQTFRFSLFYGAAYKILFGITATFAATLSEAIAWQDAMVELNIATGRTTDANNDLANQLGDIAAESGVSPAEGVLAGTRAIGLYGATQSPAEMQSLIAQTSTRVASQIALGNPDRTFQEIQGDVAAVSNAYDIGPEGQVRIADLDAYFARRIGVPAGSTLQPIAESGTVANQAGFTLEQTAAIVATLQARTGQSASTIGGLANQIFTRGGEGSLTAAVAQYGINAEASLAEQLEGLSEVYRTADRNTQNEIAALFGRGKVQNAAAVLLQELPSINEAADDAASGDAAGASEEQYRERLATLGGSIATLGGEFLQFASLLGATGILDPLYALVKLLQAGLEPINDFLAAFNTLPRVVRDGILALGALTIAARVAAGAQATGAVAGTAASAVAGSAAQSAAVGAGAATFATGAKAAGGALLRLAAHPATLALGGLIAVGSLIGSARQVQNALDTGATALGGFGVTGEPTSDDYRSRAASLREQARLNEEATGTLAQIVSFGTANDRSQDMADRLNESADYAESIATSMEEAASSAAEIPTLPELAGLTDEDIDAFVTALAEGGANADTVFQSLKDSILTGTEVRRQQEENFRPELFSAQVAEQLPSAAADLLTRGLDDPRDDINFPIQALLTRPTTEPGERPSLTRGYGPLAGQQTETVSGAQLAQELLASSAGKDEDLAQLVLDAMDAAGVRSEGGINRRTASEISSRVAEQFLIDLEIGPGSEGYETVLQQIRVGVRDKLLDLTADQRQLISPRQTFTATTATSAANKAAAAAQTQLESLDEGDFVGQRRVQSGLLRFLQQVNNRTEGEPSEVLADLMTDARRAMARAQFENLERMRLAAQTDARSKAEVRRIGRRFLAREANLAARTGDVDSLLQIIETGGRVARQVVIDALQAQLRIVEAAIAETLALGQVVADNRIGGVEGAFRGLPGVVEDEDADRRDEILSQLERARKAVAGDTNQYTRPDLDNSLFDESPAAEERDSAAQIAAARRAAGVAGDDAVGQAAAAIQQARADLSDAKPGTVEYYNALGALRDAQYSYGQAVADASAARGAAGVASDDAVGQAAAAIDAAQAQLRATTAGTAAYYNALGSLRDAQLSYAQAVADVSAARAEASVAGDDEVGQAAASITAAQAQLSAATAGTAAYYQALSSLRDAQLSHAQAIADVTAARAEASAAAGGGALSAAGASITAAQAQLDTASAGTAAYYNALGSLYGAQEQYAQALRDHQLNLATLSIDATNPLEVARVQANAAARKLADDLAAGKDADVIAQDRVDVQSTQAELEQTAFQQRLDRVQTADQLGRISHEAYIRYLTNEQTRLENIGNRTYQQQQQLNEIDGLLQDAANEMQGQFNLGDIKLPTPYLVRRAIEARSEALVGSRAGQLAAINGPGAATAGGDTINIQIDGTDVATVKRVLNDALSSNGRRFTAARGRKR